MRIPFAPMLASLSPELPKGKSWVFEEKYDGIRTLAARREGSVRLWSRTLKDLTDDFASVTRALGELRIPDAILDGEVVVFDREGVSRFQLLQRRGAGGTLAFAIFDVLELDGRSLLRSGRRTASSASPRSLGCARTSSRATSNGRSASDDGGS